MKKVYVLTGSSGAWDKYTKFVLGVYEDAQIAEQEKELIVNNLKLSLTKYTTEEINLYRKKILLGEKNAKIEEFLNWHFVNSSYSPNINEFKVTEYPSDHKILDFINYEKADQYRYN